MNEVSRWRIVWGEADILNRVAIAAYLVEVFVMLPALVVAFILKYIFSAW